MKSYLKDYYKLLKFVKSHLRILALATLCMGISTIFEGITFGMIGPLTDRIFTNKKIVIPGEIPQFLVSVVERFNSIEPQFFLKVIIIFLPFLFLVKGLFIFLQDYLMNIVGERVVKEVRNKLYFQFQNLSMEFYSRKRTGELISRVINDVSIITNSVSYGLKDLIFESMKIVFFAVVALWLGFKISWKLPFTVFIIFPLIMFPVVKLGKKIKKFAFQVQQKMADLSSQMAETIQGIHIVKAFCREKYEIDKFKGINQDYYKFNLKGIKRIIILSPLTEFIGILGAVFIIGIIAPDLFAGKFSFGIFAMFLVFLLNMIRPLKKLSNVYAINQRALAASARIYNILEEKPKIEEIPQAKNISGLDTNIKIDGVWFRYNEDEDYVLKDINLEVKKGQTIALVGHSGAGKTTLMNLLLRFYDPTRGKILIDDLDLRELRIKSLRFLISIVSQDTVLFNASLRDNIAYGKQGSSETEIIKAAKKAHAYEFVMDSPEKFDTTVGDRGFRLSGGEKQRIAIARAILKDSPILILDEATSNLDSASEKLIQEALYALMQGRTSFVIAHRLSTVQRACRIVVLDRGRIVEIGRHSDLLSGNTLYKKLYDLQFKV